jgi:hypothetical protein
VHATEFDPRPFGRRRTLDHLNRSYVRSHEPIQPNGPFLESPGIKELSPMPGSVRHIAQSFAIALVLTAPGTHAAAAQTMGTPERYTATAINMDRGATGSIEITVDRWSSDKERDALIAVVLKQGPEKLLDALQDTKPVGHFGPPGNLGWDLRFARRMSNPDGGERVVLVTDRRVSFREAVNQPRTIDYPFTVIELRLNGDGAGEGKMSVATKVIYDKYHNIITLENYGIQPVQLKNVKRERASR